MIRDILGKYCLDTYAFISADLCSPANRRLYDGLPRGSMVLFVLFPYYTGTSPKPLARFAAVPDYHIFAKTVFDEVCLYITEKYRGAFARGFADHSPFAERDGAAAAGLGIVGKNGLLINDRYSSFVCIGEIVTTLTREELTAEGITEGKGTVSYCEDCGRCAVACPGRCAGEKSRETCVSFVNQKKGELDGGQIEIMRRGGYIWGCDVCQNVCPYTKRAIENGTVETPVDFFRNGAICGDIVGSILKMSDEEYGKYPFSWRKKEVMERNIRIVCEGGNCDD